MDTDTRQGLDLWIVCICITIAWLAWYYLESGNVRSVIMICGSIGALLFLILTFAERMLEGTQNVEQDFAQTQTEIITEVVLLSEEDTELMTWDIYGKTAAVIGRDVKENQVDIDLGRTHYAGMVEIEHAVLNFSAGNWYVEDLGSKNGLSIKKAEDGRVYRLSFGIPCRIEQGDCLYIGLNRLLLK